MRSFARDASYIGLSVQFFRFVSERIDAFIFRLGRFHSARRRNCLTALSKGLNARAVTHV